MGFSLLTKYYGGITLIVRGERQEENQKRLPRLSRKRRTSSAPKGNRDPIRPKEATD
jgi:hypothetical protein